jgi:hypothetical protein
MAAKAERPLVSLQQAKAQEHGPLSRVVLEFLSVMDRVVNVEKQPAVTAAEWAPLGELIDREKFHRVGNFGESVDWPEYTELLVRWTNFSWWKGYIWRLREIPATPGQPALVYLESEERSNRDHPVREDGDYETLDSIAAYEFGADGKITALHVYDQRPM